MKRSISWLVAVLVCVQSAGAGVPQDARVYNDPDGAYRLKLPAGWKTERESEEGGGKTLISSDRFNGKLLILSGRIPSTANTPAKLKEQQLVGVSEPYFQGWLEGLKEQARVQAGQVYRTSVGGLNALRRDVTYYRGDSRDPRKGYALFILGEHTAIFLGLTGDAEGYAALDKIISDMVVEP